MNVFELPDNYEDARSLLPFFFAALLISLPIVLYRNWRFAGVAPKGAEEWLQAYERLIAVVAVISSSIAIIGRSHVAEIVGIVASLLVITGSSSAGMRALGGLSLVAVLFSYVLFPEVVA
ncbi:hypothetical protein ACXR0O_09790 [Verrucomicrobiota bacterium sgz303538]